MAKYDFKCDKCGKISEIEIPMQKYDELKEKQICNCGGKMLRTFTPIALTEYRCAGFFDTDSQRKSFR